MKGRSEQYKALITRSHRVITKVDAYYGGDLVMANVPLTDGTLAADDSGTLKGAVTLTVPAVADGTRLDPGNDPGAPLNAYGQRLRIQSGTLMPDGTAQLYDLGEYLITGWSRSEAESTLSVQAADLATLIQDDRFLQPASPAAGSTYAQAFAQIVGGILPVYTDPALPALAYPAVVWDRDRDVVLSELCRAWGARWYVDHTGTVCAVPDYPPIDEGTPPDFTITDGVDGIITDRARGAERGALFNVVSVTGALGVDGAAAPHAVAEITDPASPVYPRGPYGAVPRFYSSDLITTQAQADGTAQRMRNEMARFGRVESVGMVPDPAVELGDVARVYTADGDRFLGRVTAYTLPLVAQAGAMAVTVSTVPAGQPGRKH